MSNITIPNLPSQTATTELDLLVIVNSGETTTSKITKADFLNGVGGLLVSGNGADSLTNAGNQSKVTSQDGIWLQTTTPSGTGGFNQGLGSVVLGGYGDEKIRSSASFSAVISSRGADINAYNSFVGGGLSNQMVTGGYNGIIGGQSNNTMTQTTHSFIGGGQSNLINEYRTHSGVIGSRNGRINGSFGFISSSDFDSGKGILSSGQYNTMLSSTEGAQIQNSTNQSVIIGSRYSQITNGRFLCEISGNSNRLSNGSNSNTSTSVGVFNSVDSDVGISNDGNGGVVILGSKNSDIGVWPSGNHNIKESSVISSLNSSVKSTGTATAHSVLIGCESVNISDTNNVIVLGVNTLTGGSELNNSVVVPQLVMTQYASLDYADDTAAAAGGIVLGGLYHNAGAVRIRIT